MSSKQKKPGTIGILKTNIRSIILFELWFSILTTFGLVPLLSLLFRLVLRCAGIPYLANETVVAFISSPAVWIGIPIALILITFVTMTNIFGVITAINASRNLQKMNVSQIMHTGMQNARRVICLKNSFLALFTLLLLPFTSIIPMMGLFSSIRIPGFVMDAILANRLYSILFEAASLVILILVLDRIFILHAFVLRGEDVKAARKTALQLIHRRRLRVYFSLLLHEVVLGLILMLFNVVICAAAMGLIRLFAAAEMRHYYALHAVNIITICTSGLSALISPVLAFVKVDELYHKRCAEKELPCVTVQTEYPSISKKMRAALLIAAIVPITVSAIAYAVDSGDIWNSPRIEVAAHRGYSTIYPENNMPAFQGAIDCGADWIELDVHQTKDGVVVVTHDADIRRIAGVNKYVYDLTFEELESYDVGSWFSPDFKDLRVATLDEVIKLCKDKIRIQIELKPTGHEANFEQNVIDIVRANNFEDQCYMASMNVPCLKRIRELAPDLKTLYIAAAAAGRMTAADFADGLSVEETYITSELVSELHRAGKPCFVWTINDPDSVAYLIDCNVDGILTDDPIMVQRALIRGGMNELFVDIIDAIYGEDTYSEYFNKSEA